MSYDVTPKRDRAISVHPFLHHELPGESARQSRISEFQRLIDAGGCLLATSRPYVVRKVIPATLLGSGQADEVRQVVEEHEATVVFVDHRLSPVQQRNLEETWKCKVVDRTGLILEIFASRARTREGALQVELASLNYQVSRLVRSWTHLERQRGGFGFLGGPGERQIELDRRLIRGRIEALEKELASVRQMRATQRAGRKRKEIPTVALVGYTNAGKSTLFNRLTHANVFAADQLFATLDPTLRLLALPGGGKVMLSDTVGFVQELPHELVEAFSATLEEVTEADLILHLRDASDPEVHAQGQVVYETLAQLGINDVEEPPIIEIWNKIDLAPEVVSRHADKIGGSKVAMSALTGQGEDELLLLIRTWLEQTMKGVRLRLSLADGKTLAYCHEYGRVLFERLDEEAMVVEALLPPGAASHLALGDDGLHLLR